jgi:hypothetical protein
MLAAAPNANVLHFKVTIATQETGHAADFPEKL